MMELILSKEAYHKITAILEVHTGSQVEQMSLIAEVVRRDVTRSCPCASCQTLRALPRA
jgi:hypothetical protein